MNMYNCSAKYRDACDSGKVIYASFYRTLLMLNRLQLTHIDIKKYLKQEGIGRIALYGCNDVTELLVDLLRLNHFSEVELYDENPSKNQGKYPALKIYSTHEIANQKEYDLWIVMSNYNCNEIAEKLFLHKVDYSRVISVEEFLATLLWEE